MLGDVMERNRLRLVIPTKKGNISRVIATDVKEEELANKIRSLLPKMEAEFRKVRKAQRK